MEQNEMCSVSSNWTEICGGNNKQVEIRMKIKSVNGRSNQKWNLWWDKEVYYGFWNVICDGQSNKNKFCEGSREWNEVLSGSISWN